MPEDPTISCYDGHAEAYDEYQFAVVPHYRDALEVTAEACERYLGERGESPEILDLGCGTGNASMAVLDKIKRARIFLLDGSKGMVEVASKKIEASHPGSLLGCKVADLSGDDWNEGLGRYDAIISTLVLEHLPPHRYKALLVRCLDLLKPGGWLIAVEGYSDEESDAQEWFYDLMEERKRAVDPKLADFVAKLRDEKEIHYYTSMAKKEAWWKEAGFSGVSVLWQYLCIALMVGKKTA